MSEKSTQKKPLYPFFVITVTGPGWTHDPIQVKDLSLDFRLKIHCLPFLVESCIIDPTFAGGTASIVWRILEK